MHASLGIDKQEEEEMGSHILKIIDVGSQIPGSQVDRYRGSNQAESFRQHLFQTSGFTDEAKQLDKAN